LDDDGRPVERDLELWITCRMTHCFALGQLLGHDGSADLVAHGMEALTGAFRDNDFGGWFAAVGRRDGTLVPTRDAKEAYGHAFVILAASSAAAAGHMAGRELLAEALALHDRRFWEPDRGMVKESWDRTFSELEPYRGANAVMHTVEAYLAASDVTGDGVWRARAVAMLGTVVDRWARGNGWRVPEHFTPSWEQLPEYNRDDPAHPFRPFGATVGHALEWARLSLAAQAAVGEAELPWALEASAALFDRAVGDGWEADGAEGFVYTTGWDGEVVVGNRMHWVVAEAIGAAASLHRVTGDDRYAVWSQTWWDYVEEHLRDPERGSWHHELDRDNRPASGTWTGKPDIYHALQATLMAALPLHPSFASALKAGASPR